MPGIHNPQDFAILRKLAGFDHKFETFIETGLFHGLTMDAAIESGEFFHVKSIEISEKYCADYQLRTPFKKLPGSVNIIHGDSAALLPSIAPSHPCFFLLDAHWWHDPVDPIDCPKDGLPLFKELDYILSRPYAELVIIDDVQAFGGAHNVTDEWKEVTVDKLNDRLGARRRFSFVHELRYVVGLKEK
jgi:hypothetical protein